MHLQSKQTDGTVPCQSCVLENVTATHFIDIITGANQYIHFANGPLLLLLFSPPSNAKDIMRTSKNVSESQSLNYVFVPVSTHSKMLFMSVVRHQLISFSRVCSHVVSLNRDCSTFKQVRMQT